MGVSHTPEYVEGIRLRLRTRTPIMVRRRNKYGLDFQNRVRVRTERRVNLRSGRCVDGTGTGCFQNSWCGYGKFEREVRNLHFLADFIFKKRSGLEVD